MLVRQQGPQSDIVMPDAVPFERAPVHEHGAFRQIGGVVDIDHGTAIDVVGDDRGQLGGAFDLRDERLQIFEHEHVDPFVRPIAEPDIVADDRLLFMNQPVEIALQIRHDLQRCVFHTATREIFDRIRHCSGLLQSQLQ